jgi:hypothetical protein
VGRTKNGACGGKEAKVEAGLVNRGCSDLSSSPSKGQAESQPKKKRGFSRSEWLGIIAFALVNLAVCGLPPANPTEWLPWIVSRSYKGVPTPVYCWGNFFLFLYLLRFTRDARNRARQALHGFFTGAVVVEGVSILEFEPESSAREAGMHMGDVIIEYASEKDLTIEKLSAVMAKRGLEGSQVCVVFVRDGQRSSQTLPPGPLGISAMNTTINVLVKSE